jgi:DNA-binding GntR family transcriptional regulator
VKKANAVRVVAGSSTDGQSTEARIYHRIHTAIATRQLRPGVRLVEDQLSDVFGVSRARIRSVLQTLAREQVVTLQRNRGATVSHPTVREAREVFAARRLIEVALAHEVVRTVDARAIKRLKAHIVKEERGEKSQDRVRELKASHEFHTLLAEIVGNRVLIQFLRELMARSALITAIYERPEVAGCSHLEHARLIAFIERRDGEGLAAAMVLHLDRVESDLVLVDRPEPAVAGLHQIFSQL